MALQYIQLTDLAANATVDLLVNGNQGSTELRKVVRPSQITMAIVATAVGVELEVKAGLRTVVPRSQIPAGGTISVFPNLDQQAFSFFAASFEDVQVLVRETAGAATTDIMLTFSINPIG